MKKIVIGFFVILLILIPLNINADNIQEPIIDIDGNNVSIQVENSKEKITLLIMDEDKNRKYIDQNDTGNFKTKLKRGHYTVHVSNYEPKYFTIYNDIKVEGKKITIKGDTDKNTFVTIEVKDSKENRVYINQITSDKKGEYEFVFSLKEIGEYKAYINSSAEGECVHIVSFTTNSDAISQYKLSPSLGSQNNVYNTELSIEFPYEITIADKQEKPQVIVCGEKIENTPIGISQEKYEKKFMNVLKINPNNKKKIIIDLSREGERLDVDYNYTININKNCILYNGKPIELSNDFEWTFNTKWKDNDILKSIYPQRKNDYMSELKKLNGFEGLHVGQEFELLYKASKYQGGQITDYDYPLEWESLYPSVAEIDRNGKVIGKTAGNAVFKVSIPQAEKVPYSKNEIKYVYMEIKDNYAKKLQVLGIHDLKVQGEYVPITFDISENGTIYISDTINDKSCIVALNSSEGDLKINEKFNYVCDRGEQLIEIFKINGKEYLRTNVSSNEISRFIDIETGEIWRNNVPNEQFGSIFMQYEKNSPLFLIDKRSTKQLILYDIEKNKVIWSYNCNGYLNQDSVFVYNGDIYSVVGKDIVTLDREKNVLWSYDAYRHDGAQQVYSIYVDSNGIIYAVMNGFDNNYSIIALNSDGSFKWKSKDFSYISKPLYVEEDGGICVVVQEYNKNLFEARPALIKLNYLDGNKMDINGKKSYEHAIMQHYYNGEIMDNVRIMGQDTLNNLYTNKVVFDKDRKPVAYTDIPSERNDIIKQNTLLGVPHIKYKDGYVYRILVKDGIKNRIEKLKLIEHYIPVETSISVNSQIEIYENSQYTIPANILDQYGFNMPGELEFKMNDEVGGVLYISPEGKLKSGKLTKFDKGKFSKKFSVNIRVKDTNISQDVSIIIKQTPVPTSIYAVDTTVSDDTNIKEYTAINNIIVDSSGRLRRDINVFVSDQHGDFVKLKQIKYEPKDKELISVVGYEGSSGDYNCKYIGAVYGKKPGKTDVEISIEGTNISTIVQVNVEDINYDILWEVPTNGPWTMKRAYHVDGISNDFIYSNENYIIALDKKDGSQLWKSDVGIYYGMDISHPYVDEDGIVYVYDKASTSVAALDSTKKGQKLWGKFYGSDSVYQMNITKNYIFLMTEEGHLYKINKNGDKLWEISICDIRSKDMEVYCDEIVYVASQGEIYKVNELGEAKLFCNCGGSINIRDIDKKGNLIVEVKKGKDYEVVCIDNDGEILWTKYIDAEFTVQCSDEIVYISSYKSNSLKAKLYAYTIDGKKLFETGYKSSGTDLTRPIYQVERKPVIKNGKVYTYIMDTYAFDASTGDILWKTYIRDMYSSSPPLTLTVDDNDVIYVATGARGLFAYIVNEGKSTGFDITLNGRPNLKLNSLNQIYITVKNQTKQDKENVTVFINLINIDTNKSVSSCALKNTFNKGSSKEYSFGINIPKQGKYKLIVKAVQDGKILDSFRLNVKGN